MERKLYRVEIVHEYQEYNMDGEPVGESYSVNADEWFYRVEGWEHGHYAEQHDFDTLEDALAFMNKGVNNE